MNGKMNLCVWGFSSKSLVPVISSLEEEGICHVPIWVGGDSKRCNVSRKDFLTLEAFNKTFSTICGGTLYDRIYPKMFRLLFMFNRYNQFNRCTTSEYLNLINLQINYWCEQLKANRIDLVLFVRIPHYGPDMVLYEVARAMGIKTLMLHQSIFPERFYYLYDIEDFGCFENIPAVTPFETVEVEKKFEKDLVYMRNIKSYQYTLGHAFSDFKKDLNFNAFSRLANFKRYRANLAGMTNHQLDLDRKFVYFPLQMQPELTTTSLGGEYVDQLLAIERLSALLPEDWYIYTKENPKQTEVMRGNLFFDRLKRVRNLQVAPIDMSTYQLLRKCQFAANVTGTVCWEALTGGKKALVFGNAAYLKFPGVVQYQPDLKLDDILAVNFTHEQVEDALARHFTKTALGVVDEAYVANVPGFTIETNRKKLTSFIEMMLNDSFPAAPSAKLRAAPE